MAKKVAYSAMLVSLAMIFSYVEVLIPISFGIPGIKLGLANLVVVVGLFFMSPAQVFTVLVVRILLSSFMFGNMSSLIYSLAGGCCSFSMMVLLKRRKELSMTGISMFGGVCHNAGQLLVATIVVQNFRVLYYLPALLISGVLTGMITGIIGQNVKKYISL